jgi:hypothetical protein
MKLDYTIYLSRSPILFNRLIRSDNITIYTWRHLNSYFIKNGIDLIKGNNKNLFEPHELLRNFTNIKTVQDIEEFKEWFKGEYFEELL